MSRGRGDCDGSDRLVKHRIPRTIAAVGTGETKGTEDRRRFRPEKISSNFNCASREVIAQRDLSSLHVLAESDHLARFQIVPVQSAFVRVCWVWMVVRFDCVIRVPVCARVRPCVSRLPPVQRK